MRKNRKVQFTVKEKITILVDGETEFWYLQMIKRNNRELTVDIKPEIPQRKKIEDQYKRVLELYNVYDKVIWIIDLDVVIKEGKLKLVLDYKTSLERKSENIIVIFNQPCLEYWLVLHFKFSQPHFSNCDEAANILKKSIENYSKSENFYTKQNDDIFLKLRPYLATAIENSKKCGEFDSSHPQVGFSDMHKLFTTIKLSVL